MTRLVQKYVDRFVDRHGKPRHYFRPRKGGRRIRLLGDPGTPEFERAYEDAARRDRAVATTCGLAAAFPGEGETQS